MKGQNIKQILAKLPDSPGVYVFKRAGKILYIGKATSLCDRVRSYFRDDIIETRSPLISKMLKEFDAIEHIKTDSVLEALVLEANLIKKYQPIANIKEKDNRSFNFVVIADEEFPKVTIVRGRELLQHNILKNKSTTIYRSKIKYSFGPFPSGSQLREAMKIIRKMFPYRDEKCVQCGDNKNLKCKPCFNRQIGLCPGVCTGEITKEEYAETIENLKLFFEGKKKMLVRNLAKQMKSFAKAREFEKANLAKHTLFLLNHIQDVALIKEDVQSSVLHTFRIESYDIAHISGTNVVGVMTVVEDGEVKKSDYRKFKIRSASEAFSQVLGKNPQTIRKGFTGFANDIAALREVLSRRLGHIEWLLPDLVVVDGGIAQKRAMEKILRENHQNIPVVSVVKNEYHKPREILGDKKWLQYEREIILSNAEAHRYAINFHRQLRGKFI